MVGTTIDTGLAKVLREAVEFERIVGPRGFALSVRFVATGFESLKPILNGDSPRQSQDLKESGLDQLGFVRLFPAGSIELHVEAGEMRLYDDALAIAEAVTPCPGAFEDANLTGPHRVVRVDC